MANTQELKLMKTNQRSLVRYMKPVNAAPIPNPGTQPPWGEPDFPPEGRTARQTDGQTTQNYAQTNKLMHGWTDDLIEKIFKNTIHPETQQPQDNGTPGTKRLDRIPLQEVRMGTRGVFYQGGFCYIYLESGEQPIRCSDTRPNLGSIIRRICAKGYLVGLTYNPGRLLREDNGEFKVLLGNRRTVYMLTIFKDTPAEQMRQPQLFERNQRGEY